MSELALLTTEELLDELMRRHEHSVFAAFTDMGQDKSCYTSKWGGNKATCAGLCTKLIDSIWVDFRESGYTEKS